jgi:protein-tyrosine-phosphatase
MCNRVPEVHLGMSTNLLFICSRNQWRSPTAEAIWRRRPGFNVRSAGTIQMHVKPSGTPTSVGLT